MPVKKSVKKSVVKPSARRVVDGGKMVPFGRAIANFFRKYFQFDGVATRAEYWWIILFWVLVGFVMIGAVILSQTFNLLLSGVIALLWFLFCVVMMVPIWAVMSRRLHDAGFSAKLLWINFVFFVYPLLVPRYITLNASIMWWIDMLCFFWGIVMLVLFVIPSKTKNNPYRN